MEAIVDLLLLFFRGVIITPIKKLLSFILFPLVYPFRNTIYRASNAYSSNKWNINEIIKYNKGIKLFIWFFFDDSIYSDFQKDYHPTKHQCKLITYICKYIKSEFICDFLKSWYWSGIRNATNNLSHYLTYKFVGDFVDIEKEYLNTKHIYFVRRRYTKGSRPYLEIRFNIKNKSCYINIGWLKNGKFEGPKLRCKDKDS